MIFIRALVDTVYIVSEMEHGSHDHLTSVVYDQLNSAVPI